MRHSACWRRRRRGGGAQDAAGSARGRAGGDAARSAATQDHRHQGHPHSGRQHAHDQRQGAHERAGAVWRRMRWTCGASVDRRSDHRAVSQARRRRTLRRRDRGHLADGLAGAVLAGQRRCEQCDERHRWRSVGHHGEAGGYAGPQPAGRQVASGPPDVRQCERQRLEAARRQFARARSRKDTNTSVSVRSAAMALAGAAAREDVAVLRAPVVERAHQVG